MEETKAAASSHPGLQEQFRHKSRLQEYAQRSALKLPTYFSVNEGSANAPKFRSTVFIDGTSYKSAQTFARRKEAEQHIAKVALESILRKIKEEGCPLIQEDTTFCKIILNEFAVKRNLEKPTYSTTQCEGLLPIFISTLVLDGKTYRGSAGKSKREAEQLAARAAIQSILGTKFGLLLFQIIKSKTKLYVALKKIEYDGSEPTPPILELKKQKLEPVCGTSTGMIENAMVVLNQSQCDGQLALIGPQSATSDTMERKLPSKKNKNKVKDNNPEPSPPVRELKKPKLEPIFGNSSDLIENVTKVLDQSLCSGQPGQNDGQSANGNTIERKHPRKKKKKKKKGLKTLVDGRLVDIIVLDS